MIGRLYGRQVCAIDHRQEELDEAPEGFEKRCMDARNLQLEDTSFDHVTFFYSLMYMDAITQQRALREVFGRIIAGFEFDPYGSDNLVKGDDGRAILTVDRDTVERNLTR